MLSLVSDFGEPACKEFCLRSRCGVVFSIIEDLLQKELATFSVTVAMLSVVVAAAAAATAAGGGGGATAAGTTTTNVLVAAADALVVFVVLCVVWK